MYIDDGCRVWVSGHAVAVNMAVAKLANSRLVASCRTLEFPYPESGVDPAVTNANSIKSYDAIWIIWHPSISVSDALSTGVELGCYLCGSQWVRRDEPVVVVSGVGAPEELTRCASITVENPNDALKEWLRAG